MKQTHTLKLNEYIEKMHEIKPHLDQLGSDISLETIIILNNGCKPKLVAKIGDYLKGFDLIIEVINK